jgi:hypothetical protein
MSKQFHIEGTIGVAALYMNGTWFQTLINPQTSSYIISMLEFAK